MKNHHLYLLLLLALLSGLVGGGCSNTNGLEGFLQTPRSPVAGDKYEVLPPDVLAISSIEIEEINQIRTVVRPDGKINLPLLGEIYVAGKTPREIESSIVETAKEYYRQSNVTVEVVGYNSQKFYVFGQVARPGPMPWTGGDTLLDALARNMPNNYAWPERITLTRGPEPQRGGYPPLSKQQRNELQPEFEAAGLNEVGANEVRINLMAMVKTGDLSHNVLLKPNDVIYVPANPFASVGLALRNMLFPVRPVLETVRVPWELERAVDREGYYYGGGFGGTR